jgi:hypothetical protein
MPLKDPEARRAYHREYMRTWYQQNRETHIARVKLVTRRAREAVKRYIDDQKSRRCADCGGRFPPFLMDFDHARGTKVAILAKLRSNKASLSKIDAEIAKCDVVCANCHRLRTKLRRDGGEVTPSPVVELLGPNYASVVVYW